MDPIHRIVSKEPGPEAMVGLGHMKPRRNDAADSALIKWSQKKNGTDGNILLHTMFYWKSTIVFEVFLGGPTMGLLNKKTT